MTRLKKHVIVGMVAAAVIVIGSVVFLLIWSGLHGLDVVGGGWDGLLQTLVYIAGALVGITALGWVVNLLLDRYDEYQRRQV